MLYNLYFQQTTNLVFGKTLLSIFFSAFERVCLNVAGRDSRVEIAGAGAGAGAG